MTFVALLRGINVAGTILSMGRLRGLFGACGFDDVRTYIQSGNVVFGSSKTAGACAALIEKRLRDELGKPVGVMVRSGRELGAVVAANPFLKTKGIETDRLHVAFLSQAPKNDALKAISARDWGRDRWQRAGKQFYLYCPDGFGRSRLATSFERLLGVGATVRNWNTVTKLLEMATI